MSTSNICYVFLVVVAVLNESIKSQALAYESFDDFTSEKWYTQRLDHLNNAEQRTWQQRYFVNDKFYTDGGPVFIRVGGEERPSQHLMNKGAWIEWGEEFEALLLQLEHRYYGKSHPTEDTNVENLQYLNIDQALADLASFRINVADLYQLPNTTKWIFFGGSYPGALAAWFRAKYPELADGAVASSAVILPQTNAKEYLGTVNEVLFEYSPTCVSAISAAIKQVGALLAEGPSGWDVITNKFNLCEPLQVDNDAEVAHLNKYLSNIIGKVVQYNKEYKSEQLDQDLNGTVNIQTNVEKLCQIMENNSYFDMEIDRLASIAITDSTCTLSSYNTMIENLKMTSWNSDNVEKGGRQYMYQLCTELGFFPTSDLPNQLFDNDFPVSYFLKECADIFGSEFDKSVLETGVNLIKATHGGRDISVTNVIFPIGTKDPWKCACLLSVEVSSKARVIPIEGGSHCLDMRFSNENDTPELVNAREEIRQEIQKWIS